MRWTRKRLSAALGLPEPTEDRAYEGIGTDTRTLRPGEVFVALRGPRFDGHAFLTEAVARGAAAAVVDRVPPDAPPGLELVVVPDTLEALGTLGRAARRAANARVVAVVGSNGKTTTKELLRAVLGACYRVHATEGNLNNQVGVPLTLLRAPEDATVWVIEMGTNAPGEIAWLTRVVEPDAAVVTGIAEEHLEGLGDLDGVLREELAVLDGLRDEGPAVVGDDPETLVAAAVARLGRARVRVAGLSAMADERPEGGARGVRLEEDGSTRWRWRGLEVHLPLPGVHQVRNALLALALGVLWDVPPAAAVTALGRVRPGKLRGEWVRFGTLRVLVDCYNANPASVRAAAELLAALPVSNRKILVLGTMHELGPRTDELHRAVAADVTRYLGRGIDKVVATGRFAETFSPDDPRVLRHPDPLGAYDLLRLHLNGDEILLLKASRAEALERWLPRLAQDFGPPSE